jgi:hypothetical protein
MRPQFTTPITTLEEARAFLTYLHTEGLSYHPEDEASDCISRLVTAEEAQAISQRMDECYQQEWPKDECPCSHILNLDPEYRARQQEEAAEEAPRMTTRYQVLYEDPADGWMPTNLGIFDDAEEAKEAAKNWMEGYATRGKGQPRMALQAIAPRPLPQGCTEI